MSSRNRVLISLAVGVAVIGVYGLATDSPFVGIYLAVTVVLTLVMVGIDRAVGFTDPVLWGLALVAIGNMAGGVILVDDGTLYLAKVLGPVRYDKVFHAFATGVGTLAAWAALKRWGEMDRLTPGLGFAVVLMGCGAGALVEIVEYVGTLVVPNSSVGDYGNNMLDLVANLAGAVVAVALLHLGTPRFRQAVGG
ncbi:MAG TPA: hypothetical protein VK088_02060 [Acidimicrobiia bacterium]|nr:hypothetical protein [Acidimicrobiia bacterium]